MSAAAKRLSRWRQWLQLWEFVSGGDRWRLLKFSSAALSNIKNWASALGLDAVLLIAASTLLKKRRRWIKYPVERRISSSAHTLWLRKMSIFHKLGIVVIDTHRFWVSKERLARQGNQRGCIGHEATPFHGHGNDCLRRFGCFSVIDEMLPVKAGKYRLVIGK